MRKTGGAVLSRDGYESDRFATIALSMAAENLYLFFHVVSITCLNRLAQYTCAIFLQKNIPLKICGVRIFFDRMNPQIIFANRGTRPKPTPIGIVFGERFLVIKWCFLAENNRKSEKLPLFQREIQVEWFQWNDGSDFHTFRFQWGFFVRLIRIYS